MMWHISFYDSLFIKVEMQGSTELVKLYRSRTRFRFRKRTFPNQISLSLFLYQMRGRICFRTRYRSQVNYKQIFRKCSRTANKITAMSVGQLRRSCLSNQFFFKMQLLCAVSVAGLLILGISAQDTKCSTLHLIHGKCEHDSIPLILTDQDNSERNNGGQRIWCR